MKRFTRIRTFIVLLAFLLPMACQLVIPTTPDTGSDTATESPATTESPPPTGTATAPRATSSVPSAAITATAPAAVETWPAPEATPLARFDRAPITEKEQTAFTALSQAAPPPVRDDIQLAQAYEGAPNPLPTPVTTDEVAPVAGDVQSFNVLNIDRNVNVGIEATLLGTSEHAYFWFDNDVPHPEQASLQEAGPTFDVIYEQVVAAFGQENTPGIDGDPRLHILHASPAALCDDAERCGLAGYFSSNDALPRAVNEFSNERDMFVMNVTTFGTDFYLNVLAHEFRHMIEDNYDQSDADWEVEGSAVLAEELAGYADNAHARGDLFLENPDQQLNRWSDEDTLPRYGQGYVLNRYLYDRLGPERYREFATHPRDALDAVTAVAEAHDLPFDGHSLWLDWLVALAIHDHPAAPDQYRIGNGELNTVAMTELTGDRPFEATVSQYAADYYYLSGDGTLPLRFDGSRRVPMLDIGAASGEHYWYSNRTNYSHLQLTRSVDLRSVEKATLNYRAFYDIEYGYDFAYVFVSSDSGNSWQSLTAEHMQGLNEADNPAHSALADRFYTGQSNGWQDERIDLSPFVGQEILLRFAYVTDPILTYGGLAIDDISIPEIGFYDDAESAVDGWEAQGFTRVTATLPQQWHLQLITFEDGVPSVTMLVLDENNASTITVDLDESGGEAILIVAASAPFTLEEAAYRLGVETSTNAH